MRNLAKGFLIGLGAVLGLAALGTLAINLYVQSAAVQARLERELSAALHAPIHVERTTVTPWSGLKISGLTVPQAEGGGNFCEAKSFAAFFQLLPIFRRELIVDLVTLTEPKVEWRQTAGGKWRMPAEPAPAGAEKPPRPESPVPERVARHAKEPPFSVAVKRFRIERGAFDFFDAKGERVVTFGDVRVEGSSLTTAAAEGDSVCGKVAVRDAVFLENVRTPFRFAEGELRLQKVAADLASGTLAGAFALRTSEKHSPFTLDVKFDRIDLDRLLTESGAMPGQASGALAGWLDLYGQAGDQDSIAGRGRVVLSSGRVTQYEFFQMLGKALQIPELLLLDLQQAQADFAVSDGRVHLDELLLRTANLKLTARGDVRLDGLLKLDAQLTINQRISRQLPAFVEGNFRPGEEPDTRVIDFTLTGTLAKPRTDLMERILGRKLQKEVGALFQNIFGSKRKPDEKKKDKKSKPAGEEQLKTNASPPAPSPVASPPQTPATVE